MKITENEFEEIQNAEKENYNIVLSKSHIVNVGCLSFYYEDRNNIYILAQLELFEFSLSEKIRDIENIFFSKNIYYE